MMDEPSALKRGLYIGFTGLDGAGKSTQAGLLGRYLNDKGFVSYVYEGKQDFAMQMMRLAAARHETSARNFFGNDLFDFAKTFDLLRDHSELIEPLCNNGAIVIVPRTLDCRLALAQAYGTKIIPHLEALYAMARQPDIIFHLDVPSSVALDRIENRATDRESPSYLVAFEQELKKLSGSRNWIYVDGLLSKMIAHQRIVCELEKILPSHSCCLTRLSSV